MTNSLTNPLQALIARAAVQPSSSGVVERTRQRLAAATDTIVILADVSSSMADSAGSQRKIDLLHDALLYVHGQLPQARLVAFASTPCEVSVYSLPPPSGGTDLAAALRLILPWNPRKTVVLCDGQPDDPEGALAVATQLSGVIDSIYCGPESDIAAIAFMRRLAAISGGTVTVTDIVRPAANLRLSFQRTLALPDLHLREEK